MSFSPDGKLLLVGDRWKPAVVWRTDDGTIAATYPQAGPQELLLSPDAEALATFEWDGATALWCR